MHGLINRTIERFVRETRGDDLWLRIAEQAELGFVEFEAMLGYDAALTERVLERVSCELLLPREAVLEDIGTYLVSHQKTEAVRRLLRFGGVDFVEFLHSLEDLPDRARLAVADLNLPELELDERATGQFSLTVLSHNSGFGAVLLGVLRAMADDYGALAVIERRALGDRFDALDVRLLDAGFADGRSFDLARGA